METVYHQSAAPYYPQTPTIELVRRELCAHGVGAFVEDAVRHIASRIGRSAGAISPALKRLAADGWISYLSDGRGTLIEVLKSDQETDRSLVPDAPPAAAEIAAGWAESPHEIDQATDRLQGDPVSDQSPDRSACMDDHDLSLNSSSSTRAPLEKNDWSGLAIAGADFVPIAALEKAGITPDLVMLADAKMQTRSEYDRPTQIRVLFRSLLTHQPIYSAAEIVQQESRYERPVRSVQSHHAPRPNRRSAACAPEPNDDRDAEFAAGLAEFERYAASRHMPRL